MADVDLSRRIVYAIDGMADIAPSRLVYRRAEDAELLMDVYAPPARVAPGPVPALCFVHGGPIPPAMTPPNDWGVFQSYGQLAAASGLAGIVFNHRLFAPTAYPTAEDDVRAAIEYVRANAAAIGVLPDRIGLWVFSGGGPLVSWCLREAKTRIRCLLAFYAILDLRHLTPADAPPEQADRMRRLSPAANLGNAPPPVFVARAGLDAPAINASIDVFIRESLGANVQIDVLTHPHGHHAFDLLDDDERSREIIARAVAFAHSHLTSGRTHELA